MSQPLENSEKSDSDSDFVIKLNKKTTITVVTIVIMIGILSSDFDNDKLSNASEIFVHGTNHLELDTDRDGLDDKYELENGLKPRSNDSDGDGLKDGTEVVYLFTDPLNSDTDNDSLSDSEEVEQFNTNPNDPDTDNDSLSDSEEVIHYNTNPLHSDTDSDGLSDAVELYSINTDPLILDTDTDGLSDGIEVQSLLTDPLVSDTDNDSISDGDEHNQFLTNPLLNDTDGDGLLDGFEILNINTNPLANDTDGDGIDDGVDISPTLDISVMIEFGFNASYGDSFSPPDPYFLFDLESQDGTLYTSWSTGVYVDTYYKNLDETGHYIVDWDDSVSIFVISINGMESDAWNADETLDLGGEGTSEIIFNIEFESFSNNSLTLNFTPAVAFDSYEGHACNFSIRFTLVTE